MDSRLSRLDPVHLLVILASLFTPVVVQAAACEHWLVKKRAQALEDTTIDRDEIDLGVNSSTYVRIRATRIAIQEFGQEFGLGRPAIDELASIGRDLERLTLRAFRNLVYLDWAAKKAIPVAQYKQLKEIGENSMQAIAELRQLGDVENQVNQALNHPWFSLIQDRVAELERQALFVLSRMRREVSRGQVRSLELLFRAEELLNLEIEAFKLIRAYPDSRSRSFLEKFLPDPRDGAPRQS